MRKMKAVVMLIMARVVHVNAIILPNLQIKKPTPREVYKGCPSSHS